MGKLSTHVLDTANGKPAAGMSLRLFGVSTQGATLIKSAITNADGRVDGALLEGEAFKPGRYRLEFSVAPYFAAQSDKLPKTAFLDVVPIEFGVADSQQNYHIPLLVSPWSYSTYRGS
jgi:5-hydroxyisourate hydrolase